MARQLCGALTPALEFGGHEPPSVRCGAVLNSPLSPCVCSHRTCALARSSASARRWSSRARRMRPRRAMVPTGVFETLMPQDYLPTQLLSISFGYGYGCCSIFGSFRVRRGRFGFSAHLHVLQNMNMDLH